MSSPIRTSGSGSASGFSPRSLWVYALLTAVSILIVAPLLWAVSSSFTANDQVYRYVYPFSLKAFIPQAFTLSAYQTLFFEKGFGTAILSFGTAILNTSLLTIGTVLIGGLINLLAGFAFGVFDFRGKNLLFGIVLFTFMVPIEVTIIPQYIQMRDLGWINTWQGLLVPGLANSLVIFLFRQFFAEFPRDLLDAARVDGASWSRILFSLVVPASRPVLVGAGLVLFLSAWNAAVPLGLERFLLAACRGAPPRIPRDPGSDLALGPTGTDALQRDVRRRLDRGARADHLAPAAPAILREQHRRDRDQRMTHHSAPARQPIPVVLDTDIGTDIDDTWALAFLLRCPELDVRLITTATGDTFDRARLSTGPGSSLACSRSPGAPTSRSGSGSPWSPRRTTSKGGSETMRWHAIPVRSLKMAWARWLTRSVNRPRL